MEARGPVRFLRNEEKRMRICGIPGIGSLCFLFLACADEPPPVVTPAELFVNSEGPSLQTSENGQSTTLTVVLSAAPLAPVTVPIASTDPGEASAMPASVEFSADDWSTPQTVTVVGADDFEMDGPQTFRVSFGPTTSNDRAFAGLVAESPELTNVDDDSPGITVTPPSGPTSETGATANFRIVLNTRPSAEVTISFESNDPSEGTLSAASTTFNTTNWNAPQIVTVVGVDDEEEDGDQTFAVVFAPVVSDDPAYAAVPAPAEVPFTNLDDEGMIRIEPPAVTNRTVTTLAPSSRDAISYGGYMNGESYQQDAILTVNGYQYAAYWNAAARVILARRPEGEGAWTRIEMDTGYSSTSTDSHNTISLGASGDGRLHIAFDHHDSPLHYVQSVVNLLTDPETVPWASASFSRWTGTLDGTTSVIAVTYPKFITEPDGKLLFEYRYGAAGRADQVLWEYDAGTWTYLGAYVSGMRASGTINAYLHGIEYSGTRLHAAWCWRTSPDPSTNRGLFYAYSDNNGRTWNNNAGMLIGTIGASPVLETSPGIEVWPIGPNRGYINQEHMTVDNAGRVHVLVTHAPDETAEDIDFERARTRAEYFHYWRSPAGRWTRTPMGFPAQLNFRGKLVVSSRDEIYAILPNIRIAGASPEVDWTNWTLIETEFDGNYFSDPLIDRQQLRLRDRLTIFAPRTPVGVVVIDTINYDLESRTR
jgi:hypothetical protein